MISSGIFTYETIRWFARASLVQGFTLLLLILSMVSLALPYTGTIKPLLILIPIYYWGLYRPSFISLFAVFAFGILIDLLANYPVGLHAALFVIAGLVIRSQRLFMLGQPYLMVWLGFAIVSTSVYVAQWLFFMLIHMRFMPVQDLLASNVMAILLYPAIAAILTVMHRILPALSKSY